MTRGTRHWRPQRHGPGNARRHPAAPPWSAFGRRAQAKVTHGNLRSATKVVGPDGAGRTSSTMDPSELDPDPLVQLGRWLAEAEQAGVPEPTAMALATATPDGIPSARMVLLKGLDARGLVWFTNYNSAKAHDLAVNPKAALVFRWEPLGRQVRATGDVSQLDADESDAYFATRDRGSQLGAWASPQSEELGSRQQLEGMLEEVTNR